MVATRSSALDSSHTAAEHGSSAAEEENSGTEGQSLVEELSPAALKRFSAVVNKFSATESPSKTPTRSRPELLKRKLSSSVGESPAPSSSLPTSPSPRKGKKRARTSAGYAPPSTYAHLPLLPDAITPGLLVLFIGLNPGVQTARTGHAYAHPSNLFWRLLYSSGLTPVRCTAEEDRSMPARFRLGHTNIVARPSRSGAELSRAEMDAGVAALEAKCRRFRPEVVCITGKSIWESVFRVRHGRPLARADAFEYGWQDGEKRMGAVSAAEAGAEDEDGEEPWEGSRIFVASSTSGLAASLRPAEKERIWKVLGDWCVQRRRELGEEHQDPRDPS